VYSRWSPSDDTADECAGRFGLAANGARERLHDTLEDILAAQAVLARELDRAVQLEDDPPSVAVREEVDPDDVTRELEELTTLVANIVELARGSQRDLHLEHVRLHELAERALERAEDRFPRLEFVLDADETTVWGDPEELERAVWNLVENAAKWSNSGDRIELTIVGGEVTVRDHGPGVPEADRPFVFDRFYRSEAARSQPGSGLGLAIVRQIADSHGGRVEVESAPGGGARFRLTLVEATDPKDARRTETTAYRS
jgi:two-component system, OmpR family, sensor histidine kinase MprB